MTDLVNVRAGEALDYPAYFRATYQTGRFDLEAQLGSVVAGVVESMRSSELAVPINNPQPVTGDRVAILDLRVTGGAKSRTVAELVSELDVVPFWGWWFEELSAVRLKRIERISQQDAYSEQSRDDERKAQNNDANTNDTTAKILAAVKALVLVLIVIAVLYAAVQFTRLRKAVTV